MCFFFSYFLLVETQRLVSGVQQDWYLYANSEEVLVKVLGTVT